jgi:transposase
VTRFPTKQALASYAGLVPVVRESAGKRKGGGITHQGSNTLRWIMLQVAQVAVRHSPAQVARIAVARKLLAAIWVLLRHGVCFEESAFARGQAAATASRKPDYGKVES